MQCNCPGYCYSPWVFVQALAAGDVLHPALCTWEGPHSVGVGPLGAGGVGGPTLQTSAFEFLAALPAHVGSAPMPATHHVRVRAVIMLPASHMHAGRSFVLSAGCTCKPMSARFCCQQDHTSMTADHQHLLCLALGKAHVQTVFGLNTSQGRNRQEKTMPFGIDLKKPKDKVYWASLWVPVGPAREHCQPSFAVLCMVQHSDGLMTTLCGI